MRDYRLEAEKARQVVEGKVAQFTNWTDEDFTGYWDGRPHFFKAGQSKHIQEFKARHFAIALTNRELLRKKLDENGEIIRNQLGQPVFVIPNGDRHTSPKKIEDDELFMNLFNRAFKKGEDTGEAPAMKAADIRSELGVPVFERKSEIRERENKERMQTNEEPALREADLPVDEEDEFEDAPKG